MAAVTSAAPAKATATVVPTPSRAVSIPTPLPPTPLPTQEAAFGFNIDGFVFPDSSERYLSYDELLGLSKEILGFARNEIFARNGNLFRKDKYIDHYTAYGWYNSIPNKRYDIAPEELNLIEQANIKLILQREAELG